MKHGESRYPHVKEIWNHGEPSQQQPAHQNDSESSSATHPGGHMPPTTTSKEVQASFGSVKEFMIQQ